MFANYHDQATVEIQRGKRPATFSASADVIRRSVKRLRAAFENDMADELAALIGDDDDPDDPTTQMRLHAKDSLGVFPSTARRYGGPEQPRR